MKIVIPMSGRGQRFVNKGYKVPKPLIEVDGKPIIEHVVDMFPGEDDFIFICAKDHLESTEMKSILNRIAPKGRIIAIEPHKLGPIYAVQKAYQYIEDDEEVIVNYCDFGCYWDYGDFLTHTRQRNADGAIPAYKGFHPHMLGTTNYAFMRDHEQWMLEIQEKKPFTENRMNEYASSGTYYFKSGALLKKYFDMTVERDLNLNGEYYVSVVYNLLIEEQLKVSIYEIQHMLQWGTPEDVEDYLYHSNYFRKLIDYKPYDAVNPDTINLIPLAGEGSRFKNEGYVTPKPLIEISGKPMIFQAFDSYPKSNDARFIVLANHCDAYGIDDLLSKAYHGSKIISLDHVTEGQAITASLGIQEEDMERPLLIAACDNGLLIDENRYRALISDSEVDAICFVFKNNPTVGANPKGYGYIKANEDGKIQGVSVKVPISDTPTNDPAIVGAFYFSKAKYFMAGVEYLKEHNIRVNNEFYIDSIMGILDALQISGHILACDYESWGTPNDYLTFSYWQSFFHKSNFHPYRIELDATFNQSKIKAWNDKFYDFKQENR
ncbi:NTP transferase domain-containing protein [Fusibacter bizertensis]